MPTAPIMEIKFTRYWLLNIGTGEVYSLGPMYGGSIEYARKKLESERLLYDWILLAPVAEREKP